MADTHGHDLDKWRKSILSKRPSREYVEGFQVADMDNGAMWDLLKLLTAYDPSKRLSAAAALRHPAFGTGLIGRLNVLLSSVGNATDKVIATFASTAKIFPCRDALISLWRCSRNVESKLCCSCYIYSDAQVYVLPKLAEVFFSQP